MANQACMEFTAKILKVVAYLLTFIIVLIGGVVAKGCVIFMASQLKRDKKIPYCNKDLGRNKQFLVSLPEEERIAWMWVIMFAFAVPEVGLLIRSMRICFFKSWKKPSKSHFLLIFLMESFHVLGIVLLLFVVIPELDSVKAAMLTNCLCVVPGILGLLSRTAKEGRRAIKVIIDLGAVAAQVTGFFVWPLLEDSFELWLIPVACLMISCGWWENYVSPQSPFSFVKSMGRVKEELKLTRYFTYMFMTIWKVFFFFLSVVFVLWFQGEDAGNLFALFGPGFSSHKIVVEEIAGFAQNLPDVDSQQVSFTFLFTIKLKALSQFTFLDCRHCRN